MASKTRVGKFSYEVFHPSLAPRRRWESLLWIERPDDDVDLIVLGSFPTRTAAMRACREDAAGRLGPDEADTLFEDEQE
jgi:hypothetical protein